METPVPLAAILILAAVATALKIGVGNWLKVRFSYGLAAAAALAAAFRSGVGAKHVRGTVTVTAFAPDLRENTAALAGTPGRH